MATHSSTLALKIPWMEEPGRLQSMGLRRVGHDWVASLSLFTFMHWRRQWQPTPVFLPGASQGRGSLVGWQNHKMPRSPSGRVSQSVPGKFLYSPWWKVDSCPRGVRPKATTRHLHFWKLQAKGHGTEVVQGKISPDLCCLILKAQAPHGCGEAGHLRGGWCELRCAEKIKSTLDHRDFSTEKYM